MATKGRRVERWARSGMGGGAFAEVERRVLLESEYATQPSWLERFRKSGSWVTIQILVGVSPIGGVAAFLSSPDLTGWRNGFDPETALVVGGICFVLAAAMMLAFIVEWFLEDRERPGAMYGATFYVLIPALISLAVINGDNHLDPWSGWAMPIWVTAALGVLLLVASVVAGRPPTKDDGPKVPQHPMDIASLPAAEVEALLELRDQIMVFLVEKERYKPEAAKRARQVPLGELYTLDAEESLKVKK